MLRAHANMPIADFIAQLRTYVIAMGWGTQVVDCVDDLTGISELEHEHADERDSVKEEIIALIEHELDANPDLSAEAILGLIEGIEV